MKKRMIVVGVFLDSDERLALQKLADRERRNPRDQAAMIIRRALESENLLPIETPKPAQPVKAMPKGETPQADAGNASGSVAEPATTGK